MKRFWFGISSTIILSGCATSGSIQGIPHRFLETPSLQIQGEVLRQTDQNFVQLMQYTGHGGVDGLLLLRDPFFRDLLAMKSYENRLWGIKVASVPVNGHGDFNYVFPGTKVYAAQPRVDDSPLSFIALIVRIAGHGTIFGIEFDDDEPKVYKFNRTTWEFDPVQATDAGSPISVCVFPESRASNFERVVTIRIE